MMIALPNQDRSWTVTLFMPFEIFENVRDPKGAYVFFEKTFPDSIPLLTEKQITEEFVKLRARSLVTVYCDKYHVGKKTLLIGACTLISISSSVPTHHHM